MESRHEENIISRLQDIFLLALELPVRIVDQDEDPRTSVVIRQRWSDFSSGGREEKEKKNRKRKEDVHSTSSTLR